MDSTQTLNSDLIDPLTNDSFFPHATNFSSISSSSIFDALYKPRVSSSPAKLLKQGKTILEGGMDQIETDKNEKGGRGRRPGLGIPQKKFTMRPMTSQLPAGNIEPTCDLSISDPVKFFQDFESKEKARKEMRRLNGQPLYDFDPNQPLAPRPRRPGLLGSTTTNRQRSYPSFSLAKEMFVKDITTTTHNDVLQDSNVESSNVKVSDSQSKTASEVTSCDVLPLDNKLDEDVIQNFFREELNLENPDVGEFVLPEWRVPLPDSVLNLHDVSKSSRSRNQASPGKLKSPLAFISSLNRHIAKRTPVRDPFSTLNIDLSPAETIDHSTEPERSVDLAGQSDKIGPNNDPREKEGMVEQVSQISDTVYSHELENVPVHGEENIAISGEDALFSPSKVFGASEPEIQEEVAAAQLPVRQLDFEDPVLENSSANGVEDGVHEPSNTDNSPVKELAKELRRTPKRRKEDNAKMKLPSEAVISEETVKEGGETTTSELSPLVSKETRNKKRKVDGGQQDRKKGDKQLRRFSLYNAGTKWEEGVRRSSRIRMRPLQFWKGERFLYGRVNESLATVIGVKYASPSKDTEEQGLKVKSFVSGKHEDLLKFYDLY